MGSPVWWAVGSVRNSALKMGQVATVLTKSTPAKALGAILYVLPSGSTRTAANMIAAQSAIETANWKSMHNWNMGNVTPSQGQISAGISWMNQNLPMKYIAFSDIVAGSRAMVNWIIARGALPAANSGDLVGYMSKLQASCYLGCIGNTDPTGHTVTAADYAGYQSGIASRMSTLATVTPEMPSWWEVLSPADIALGTTAVAAAAVGAIALTRPEWIEDLRRAI